MPRLLDEIPSVSAADWHARVESDLRGADFRRAVVHTTPDGLEIQPLYHPGNAPASIPGAPGDPPYTRGARLPSPGRVWTVAQEVDVPDPAEANRRLLRDLEQGVGLAWVRSDLTGEHGVRIGGAGDLGTLLAGVEPTYVELIFELAGKEVAGGSGAAGPSVLAGWVEAWAETRGLGLADLRGGFACDPLGRLACRGGSGGCLEEQLDGAYAELSEVSRRCTEAGHDERGPRLRSVVASSLVFHDAGASQVEELAYSLASGVESLRRLESRGLELEAAADQVAAVHAVGTELFLEIAKLRAWRLLWTKVLTAAGVAAAAGRQRLHLRPSRVAATRVDPRTNLLRGSVQAFVGAVAGADSIVTGTYDQASGVRDPGSGIDAVAADHARRVAVNTQHVLAEEGHLARVADPAGGSWAIEALTEKLARAAWELFRDVERRGGLAAALAEGAVQARIRETVTERRSRLARRKQGLVGVSVFPLLGERRPSPSHPIGTRHGETAAAGPPPRAGDIEPLETFRAARPFERLRSACDALAESGSGRPRIFVARLGTAADARARAEFAAGLFSVGGVETVGEEATEDADALARAFLDTGASVAVLCSSDERYGELVPAAARALRAAGATRLYLAGRPGEAEAAYRAAGLHDFVYLGCDVVAVLEDLLGHLGVVESGIPESTEAEPGREEAS